MYKITDANGLIRATFEQPHQAPTPEFKRLAERVRDGDPVASYTDPDTDLTITFAYSVWERFARARALAVDAPQSSDARELMMALRYEGYLTDDVTQALRAQNGPALLAAVNALIVDMVVHRWAQAIKDHPNNAGAAYAEQYRRDLIEVMERRRLPPEDLDI